MFERKREHMNTTMQTLLTAHAPARSSLLEFAQGNGGTARMRRKDDDAFLTKLTFTAHTRLLGFTREIHFIRSFPIFQQYDEPVEVTSNTIFL